MTSDKLRNTIANLRGEVDGIEDKLEKLEREHARATFDSLAKKSVRAAKKARRLAAQIDKVRQQLIDRQRGLLEAQARLELTEQEEREAEREGLLEEARQIVSQRNAVTERAERALSEFLSLQQESDELAEQLSALQNRVGAGRGLADPMAQCNRSDRLSEALGKAFDESEYKRLINWRVGSLTGEAGGKLTDLEAEAAGRVLSQIESSLRKVAL